MRYSCCVPHCFNSSASNPDLQFFGIPIRRKNEWLSLIAREDLFDKPISKVRKVCEIHFTRDSFYSTTQKKILKRTALPSCYLPSQEIIESVVDVEATSEKVASKTTQTEDELRLNTQTVPIRKEEFNINQNFTFLQLCDTLLTKELAQLIKANCRLRYKSKENCEDYKQFCLELYQTSPQAYRLLQSVMGLPTSFSLFKQFMTIDSINDQIMFTLKTTVDKMTAKEKYCSVVVGSVNLKVHLCYNVMKDKIIGFKEINGVQSPEPTTKALVVMVRGIFGNWKQPIGYALIPESKYEGEIANWIHYLLERLFEIGLNVRTFVTAIEDDLRNVINQGQVSIENPYFIVNNRKIYYIFDAPDLVMAVRNSMLFNDFHFQDHVVKHEYIVQFYNEDQKKRIPLASKLTNSHISPIGMEKQQVQYAVELLSSTVANGLSNCIDFKLIEEAGRGTVEFITKINNIFDMLNASKRNNDDNKYQKAFCGEETQRVLFEEMFILFQNVKVVNSNNGEDVTLTEKFIQGFLVTIKSISLLFHELKEEGHCFIMTRNLQRKTLETFFKHMVSINKRSTKFTSQQFTSAFRKLFFSYHKKFTLQGSSKEEFEKFLVQTENIEDRKPNAKSGMISPKNSVQTDKITNNGNIDVITHDDYNQIDTPEKHSLFFVCAHLLEKSSIYHTNCQTIQSYMEQIKNFQKPVPSDDFLQFVELMEEKFKEAFERKTINNRIAESLYNDMKDINFSQPCPCFPKSYLINLFIRIRIFYTVRANNRQFQKHSPSTKSFLVPELHSPLPLVSQASTSKYH